MRQIKWFYTASCFKIMDVKSERLIYGKRLKVQGFIPLPPSAHLLFILQHCYASFLQRLCKDLIFLQIRKKNVVLCIRERKRRGCG